jgi:hypothetical protein
MKTKLVYFVLFVALAFIVIGCDGDDLPGAPVQALDDGGSPDNNPLFDTKWKLTEASVRVSSHEPEVSDYSGKNIIFEFHGNNNLVITGSLPDNMFNLNAFNVNKGKHFYEYRKADGWCGNEPELRIDPSILGTGTYYYLNLYDELSTFAGGDNFVMVIYNLENIYSGEESELLPGTSYLYSLTFIKLK